MKQFLLAAAALCLLAGLSSSAARADGGLLPGVRVKAGLFLPQNSSVKSAAGNTWIKFGADMDLPSLITFLGSHSRLGAEVALHGGSTVIPITLTQIWKPSTAVRSPFYFGGGVGIWTAHISGSSTASRLGLRAVAGVDFTDRFFAEASYDLVGKFNGGDADGLSIMAGTKF